MKKDKKSKKSISIRTMLIAGTLILAIIPSLVISVMSISVTSKNNKSILFIIFGCNWYGHYTYN